MKMLDRGSFTIEYVEYTDTGVVLHWRGRLADGEEVRGKQEIDARVFRSDGCSYVGCNHTVGFPAKYCTCHGIDGTPCPDVQLKGPPAVWQAEDGRWWWDHFCESSGKRHRGPMGPSMGRTRQSVFCPKCRATSVVKPPDDGEKEFVRVYNHHPDEPAFRVARPSSTTEEDEEGHPVALQDIGVDPFDPDQFDPVTFAVKVKLAKEGAPQEHTSELA